MLEVVRGTRGTVAMPLRQLELIPAYHTERATVEVTAPQWLCYRIDGDVGGGGTRKMTKRSRDSNGARTGGVAEARDSGSKT